MSAVPTVKIKATNKEGYVVINKSDQKPTDVLYEAPHAPAAPPTSTTAKPAGQK